MKSILFAILAGGALFAETPSAQKNTFSLDPAKGSPAATLADASWLVGHWTGTGLGGETEEAWLKPKAGAMLGTFRVVKGEGVMFYEILTITEENGSLSLNIRHFNPDLTGWEEKDKVLRFPLVRITPTELFFSGITLRKLNDREIEAYVNIRKRPGGTVEERFPSRRADIR